MKEHLIAVTILILWLIGMVLVVIFAWRSNSEHDSAADEENESIFSVDKPAGIGLWQICYSFLPGIPALDGQLQQHASIEILSVSLKIDGYSEDILPSLNLQQRQALEIMLYNEHIETELGSINVVELVENYSSIPSDVRTNYN